MPPSKNLIEAAKLVHDARHPRYPGLAPAKIDIDFRILIEQKDDLVHGYREKKYESLTGREFSIGKTGELCAEKLLLATGHRPNSDKIATMAEALKIIASSRHKDPAKRSCCAE